MKAFVMVHISHLNPDFMKLLEKNVEYTLVECYDS
ncbi:hypothetical protein N752_31235 [Desulforamulus aquiferis]|nr:hypothetical protein N752_31235 [Desulforamulus aquiferis]